MIPDRHGKVQKMEGKWREGGKIIQRPVAGEGGDGDCQPFGAVSLTNWRLLKGRKLKILREDNGRNGFRRF